MNIEKYISSFKEYLIKKKYSKNTIENYTGFVKLFLLKHEDHADPRHITTKSIELYLKTIKTQNTRKAICYALKVYYGKFFKYPDKLNSIETPKGVRSKIKPLSLKEAQALFDACDNTKHLTVLTLMYSCGLRLIEIRNLKWSSVDFKKNVLILSKNGKSRIIRFSDKVADVLKKCSVKYPSKDYVLKGATGTYSEGAIQSVVRLLALKAGLKRRIYPNLVRQSMFTQMIEDGVDLRHVLSISGYARLTTIQNYNTSKKYFHDEKLSPINKIKIG